jgi:hypothetical protein
VAQDRVYKGQIIRECERVTGAHSGKWIILGHMYGMEISDDISPHFQTLKEAKEYIRDNGTS